jgi:alpha-beta hydrolase superfamily lysophospholipase
MVLSKVFGVDRDVDMTATAFPSEEEIAKREEPLGEHEHGWFQSCIEGAQLHTRALVPKGKPKAVVVFMHGITGHSGDAFQLSDGRKTFVALMRQVFNDNDIALHCFDHYGHGYSEGTRFFVPSYKENLQDYLTYINMVDELYKGEIPVFLMGVSYGGNLTIHASRRFQDDPSSGPKKFCGAILFCPAVTAEMPPAPVYYFLRYVLAPMFPKWTPSFMPNPVSAERCWKDPEVLRLQTDPRIREINFTGSGLPFRLGTALAMVQSLEDVVTKSIPGFKQPFFLAHGKEDYAVTIEGSKFFCRTVETPQDDQEVHYIEGGYHDLLSLPESHGYVESIVAWMEKRLQK